MVKGISPSLPSGIFTIWDFFHTSFGSQKFYFLHRENRVTTDSCHVWEVSHTTCAEGTQRGFKHWGVSYILHLFNTWFSIFLQLWKHSQLYVSKFAHREQIFKACEKHMLDDSLKSDQIVILRYFTRQNCVGFLNSKKVNFAAFILLSIATI